MARFPVHGFYQDGAGNMVVGGNATFYEYKAADPSNPDTIAIIYTAKTGGSAVASGIITTDSNGAYLAWFDDSDYSATSIFTLILSKSTHADVPIHFIFSGLSFKDVTEILTNKTLTTPIIASFTNATHDHADAAGGGNTLLVPTIASFTNATHNHSDAAGGGNLTDVQATSLTLTSTTDTDTNTVTKLNIIAAHGSLDNSSGTPAWNGTPYNFTASFTDNGTGDTEVFIDTDMADANYTVLSSIDDAASIICSALNKLAGSFDVRASNDAGTAVDRDISIIVVGAQ
jgi:hypothetical protein